MGGALFAWPTLSDAGMAPPSADAAASAIYGATGANSGKSAPIWGDRLKLPIYPLSRETLTPIGIHAFENEHAAISFAADRM